MQPQTTITRNELAESVFHVLGLSRTDSANLVDSVLEEIAAVLASGENVKISGFGTFVLRDKTERVGRNPKTGIEVPITPRRVVTFKASALLKEKMDATDKPAPRSRKAA
jgi:integration host factor subunit alpha